MAAGLKAGINSRWALPHLGSSDSTVKRPSPPRARRFMSAWVTFFSKRVSSQASATSSYELITWMDAPPGNDRRKMGPNSRASFIRFCRGVSEPTSGAFPRRGRGRGWGMVVDRAGLLMGIQWKSEPMNSGPLARAKFASGSGFGDAVT
jgi:hypothetical protein